MAITFGSHRKKEKKMILIAVVVLVVGGIIGGIILTQQRAPRLISGLEAPKPPKPPKINWEFLDDPRIEKLQSLIQIPPLTEKAGRENPFLPY